MRHRTLCGASLGVCFLVLALPGALAAQDLPDALRTRASSTAAFAAEWQLDGAGFEDVKDPALSLFALPDPLARLRRKVSEVNTSLDEVVQLRHVVPLPGGEEIHLGEFFTLRSWLRSERRAVLFLGGTALTASGWDIPFEGYSGPRLAAKRGMFAYTIDYLGVGENYDPEGDAKESTFEANLAALKTVIRYIRHFRAAPRLDLVGESWGGAFASQLAADAERVRSCVMSSMTYKDVINPRFRSPEFVAYLKSLDKNYMPFDPSIVAAVAGEAPSEVQDYIIESQAGPLLTSQLWQIIEGLPHFDPSMARVPGLVISSPRESKDGRALASDYGSAGAEFFEIGHGHAPRLEAPGTAKAFWAKVFEFIDPQIAAR